ncbi:MAG: rhomboid family intramembrane serine protease [Rhodomicrobium sp.]
MLFVPVWDLNPLKAVKFQYVTVGIIAIDVLIYFGLQSNLFFNAPPGLAGALLPTPDHVVPLGTFLRHLPDQYKLLTYMFLHGSSLHLLFNMIFLFVFGDNVEDAMGHFRFVIFYLACGVIAALVYCSLTEVPDAPLIGASGAVSGVIGAYLVLHPNIRVWVLVPLPKLSFLPLRFSAGFVIGVWILYQFASAIYFSSEAVAWWAHVGGFFAGAILVALMKRRGVRLFDAATGV